MNQPRILVVDDKRDLASGVALVLGAISTDIRTAHSGEEALSALREQNADLVFTDIRMPGMTGLELLERIRESCPNCRVVLFTAYGTIASAVQAMKAGAFHYLTKPFDNDELLLIARRALKEKQDEEEICRLRAELDEQHSFEGIYSRDPRMLEIFKTIEKIGPTNTSVLVRGESGTGKELIVRALHAVSNRSNGPFVGFNAAAVPDSLAEGELFGSRKGAYTGSSHDHKGLFVQANGGTLFIDELSSMSLGLQGKLLRAIQEREVLPLGGDRPVPVDVRIVSALNADPLRLVRDGTLRNDLYYRLAVVRLTIPPLRERVGDIPLLATMFLERHCRDNAQPPRRLSGRAVRLLMSHTWPGNVRELQNVMERAALMATTDEVGPRDIVLDSETDEHPAAGDDVLSYETAKNMAMERFQRRYMERLLAECDGNISAAARRAGITRAAIHRILKRLEIGGNQGDPVDDTESPNSSM